MRLDRTSIPDPSEAPSFKVPNGWELKTKLRFSKCPPRVFKDSLMLAMDL